MKVSSAATRRSRRLLASIATLAALGAACTTGTGTGSAGAPPPADAVHVMIAPSPEKVELLGDLADEFNGRKVEVGGKPVFVEVEKVSSGTGADLLVNDWPESSGQARPTVFTPAASLWGRS